MYGNNGNYANENSENAKVLCGKFNLLETRKMGTILAAEIKRAFDEEKIYVTPFNTSQAKEEGIYPFYEPEKGAKRSTTELGGPIFHVKIVGFSTQTITVGDKEVEVYESLNFIPHCFLKRKDCSVLFRRSNNKSLCLVWIKDRTRRKMMARFLKKLSAEKWRNIDIEAEKEMIEIKTQKEKPEIFYGNIIWALEYFGILNRAKA